MEDILEESVWIAKFHLGLTSSLMESLIQKRILIISLDNPLSEISSGYDILELWYVKVDSAVPLLH